MLNNSSWHRLETVGVMPDAAAMIAAGEKTGAWPVELVKTPMMVPFRGATLKSQASAIVAVYDKSSGAAPCCRVARPRHGRLPRRSGPYRRVCSSGWVSGRGDVRGR